MSDIKVPFIDLKQRFQEEKAELLACVERVLEQGHLVLTQEVNEFEEKVRAITAAQIQRIANRYFDPARRVEGIVRGEGKKV